MVLTTPVRHAGAVPAVNRMVLTLRAIDGLGGAATLTQLADATDLAKSSLSDLLGSMANAGLVRHTESGWALGVRLIELGHSALDQLSVVKHFPPVVRSVPELRHEYVRLAALDGADVVYLSERVGRETVRVSAPVGGRAPAVTTAVGKVLLASLPHGELDQRLAALGDELPLRTNRSHTTLEALRRDLDAIRQAGYAIDLEQSTVGVACIAVAVMVSSRPTSFAVALTLPSSRATAEFARGIVDALTSVASRLATHAR